MYTVDLSCGTVLTFEASSFVPSEGESVPCLRHGYCVVERRGRQRARGPGGRRLPRARPRQRQELLQWLDGCPATTITALRRQRFTLRLIAGVQRDGLVEVDWDTGTVERAVHQPARTPGSGPPAAAGDYRPGTTNVPTAGCR